MIDVSKLFTGLVSTESPLSPSAALSSLVGWACHYHSSGVTGSRVDCTIVEVAGLVCKEWISDHLFRCAFQVTTDDWHEYAMKHDVLWQRIKNLSRNLSELNKRSPVYRFVVISLVYIVHTVWVASANRFYILYTWRTCLLAQRRLSVLLLVHKLISRWRYCSITVNFTVEAKQLSKLKRFPTFQTTMLNLLM